MPYLSDLPYETRLLIWEEVLHQPRTVYLNMREFFPPRNPPSLAPITAATVKNPSINVSAPPRPRSFYTSATRHAPSPWGITNSHSAGRTARPCDKPGSSITASPSRVKNIQRPSKVMRPKSQNIAQERDTVVFGRFLPSSKGRVSRAYFPFGHQFDVDMLARIRNLAVNIDIASSVLPFLNLSPGSERFSSLRNLYVYIESEDPKHRPRRLVELVDLTEEGEAEDGRRDLTQRLLERFRTVFARWGGTVALKTICHDGLGFWRYLGLKDSLLKNGGDPDKLLKCVWLREVVTIQPC